MLKKILSIALCIAITFTLFACGGNATVSSDSSSSGGSNGNLKSQIQNCTPVSDYSGNTTVDQMDSIEFGKDEKGRLIEWIVLEKNNNKALLISKWELYKKNYNIERIDITWENSFIRQWLNSDFINLSFGKKEQGQILTTNVINNDNLKYNTSGGNNTKDKIFLLSIDEVSNYFKSEKQRVASYIDEGNPLISTYGETWGNAYWLRSPGSQQSYAAYVNGGVVNDDGWMVQDDSGSGIRPAMWVKY